MTVQGKSRWYFARLSEAEAGTEVRVFRKLPGGNMTKQIHHDVLPVPMHLAAELMIELMDKLEPPAIENMRRSR